MKDAQTNKISKEKLFEKIERIEDQLDVYCAVEEARKQGYREGFREAVNNLKNAIRSSEVQFDEHEEE